MAQAIAIALVVVFSLLSKERSREWRTDLSLWSAAVREGPAMPRSHLSLGLAYKDEALASRRDWSAAATEFHLARQLAFRTHDATLAAKAFNNLGSVALNTGDLERAEHYYRRALLLVPGQADALRNLDTVEDMKRRSR